MFVRSAVLLLALVGAMPAMAESEGSRVGAWTLRVSETGSIAYTEVESGAELGLICTVEAGACFYFIKTQIGCVEERTAPFLLAGEAGALSASGMCAHSGEDKIHLLDEDLDELVAGSGTVGVAMAMKDGKFKVLRFSMNGAITQIARAKQMHAKAREAAGSAEGAIGKKETAF